jgi:CCR4-NOT transcription complex subunit 7/8
MSKSKDSIVEVFEDNFLEEIKRLSSYLEKYKFIAMDTEFPGIVYNLKEYTKDFYYKTIKMNVDNLKVIQVGVTLCDEKGRSPSPSTWQFNLKFDWRNDKYSHESIALLNSSGIDFAVLSERGISFELFSEYLITSGLILNEEIHWISFHGSYDFAYLLKLISGNPFLPETEDLFLEQLEIYFQNFYDIRVLLKNQDSFKGSLNKIAGDLEVVRVGFNHQAGSDSIVTGEVFFRLFKRAHLNGEHLKSGKNMLFGLGEGADDYETLSYMNFGNSTPNIYIPPQSGNQNGFQSTSSMSTTPLNTLDNKNNFITSNLQTPQLSQNNTNLINLTKNGSTNAYPQYGYQNFVNSYTKPANQNVLYANMNLYNNSGYSMPIYNYNSLNNINLLSQSLSNQNGNPNLQNNNVSSTQQTYHAHMAHKINSSPNVTHMINGNLNSNMNSGSSLTMTMNNLNNLNNLNSINSMGIRNDKKKTFGKILEAKSN